MAKTKEPSQRQLRVGEEIRHILSDVFMRQDHNLHKLYNVSISVTEVDVSPDLRNATAYASVLDTEQDEGAIIKMLNEHIGPFNKTIAKKLTMKFSPKLKFSGDTRLDYAAHIDALFDKINKQQ